jgi:hypothetical protein
VDGNEVSDHTYMVVWFARFALRATGSAEECSAAACLAERRGIVWG